MPWELLPLVFAGGAVVGGVVGSTFGYQKAVNHHLTLRRAGVVDYFENLPEHGHQHDLAEKYTDHDHTH